MTSNTAMIIANIFIASGLVISNSGVAIVISIVFWVFLMMICLCKENS
jgi:hypothetical protein